MIRTIDIVTEQEREEASAAEPKSAADLPELAAAAAAADPEAIAFTHGDQAVTFGELSTKLVAMRTAMGAALAPDALVSVSLAGLVPGILPALGVDGLATLVSSVIADAQSVSAGRGVRPGNIQYLPSERLRPSRTLCSTGAHFTKVSWRKCRCPSVFRDRSR
ncbi:hypothetical protein ACETU7_34405 [Rhodococcus sp. 3Y1]